MTKIFLRLSLVALSCGFGGALWAETSPYDNVVLYEMKDDPTLPKLVGDPAAQGFYGLEIDELRGNAAVLYRSGERLYRVDMDLKVKGDELTLKFGKRRKVLGREKRVLPSGRTEEVIFPIECTPDKSGWRFGTSTRRHVVGVNDDFGKRLIVGSSYLEFQTTVAKCKGLAGDCGPAGCGEWGAAAESTATVTRDLPVVAAKPTEVVALSKALLEGKMSERDVLTTYQSEIEAILPATLTDLTVLTTSYRTTTLPFPEILDPLIDQKGLKIGVLAKTYRALDRSELTIQVQPLIIDYRPPASNKCGSWDSSSTRTLFDVKGRPAMYTQAPATTTAPVSSSLVVCGEKIVIQIQMQSDRNRIFFTGLYDTLPTDAMERLVGQ